MNEALYVIKCALADLIGLGQEGVFDLEYSPQRKTIDECIELLKNAGCNVSEYNEELGIKV